MKSFYGVYHFHPEIQITLIISGKGQCIIGDRVLNFKEGSLLVIGEDIPHVFHNWPEEARRNEFIDSVSVYFDKNAFGEQFFRLTETAELNRFMEESKYCLEIKGPTRTYVEEILIRLSDLSGFSKFAKFLEMIYVLANSSDLIRISGSPFQIISQHGDFERLNKVFDYVFTNYDKQIRLSDVSELANMTPQGFCRYFKMRTRKSFFTFLLEARISKTCELLRENKLSINQIAFSVGFNSLSHFNREFKKRMGVTPSEYAGIYLRE